MRGRRRSDGRRLCQRVFRPSSPDGHLRLHLGGENLSYTDTHGKVWWEQTSRLKNAGQGQVFESPLGCDYCPLYGSQILNPQPGWTGYPDGANFYGMSISARNDTAMRYAIGSGAATVTLYGEAGLGVSRAGYNVFDVEINGQVVDTIDGFVAAGGQYHGYTRSYNVTVPTVPAGSGAARSLRHHRRSLRHEHLGHRDCGRRRESIAVQSAGATAQWAARHAVSVSVYGEWWNTTVYLRLDAGLIATGHRSERVGSVVGNAVANRELQLHGAGMRQQHGSTAMLESPLWSPSRSTCSRCKS